MSLNKHLQISTRPIANKANQIFYADYRITVLSDRLFRLEKNSTKHFVDLASKAILFRDAQEIPFTTKQADSYFEIITKKVTLVLKDSLKECFLLMNERKILLNNEENLKGTASGLDGCEADINIYYENQRPKIIFDDGVCSKNGVAILDDSSNDLFNEEGIIVKRKEKEIDYYIFAYGHEYQESLNAFYEIAGKAPLLERFVFGVWWSRFHAYSDEEYLSLMDKFKEENIPLTVATVDMDWHYSTTMYEHYKIEQLKRNTEEYGFHPNDPKWKWGWTGYSWNESLFSKPEKFLKELHKRDLKVVLNLHPDTICWYEKQYPLMAKALGQDPEKCLPIPLDFTSSSLINNYFDIMHRCLEKQGVDFWWLDDTRYEISHYHFLDSQKNTYPLVLTRYAGIGSHRYPLGFSGDSVISWKSLNYLPYFTINATNIGYTWWSHDIGGFMAGIKDDELYLRYVQLGVFLPILRLHCQSEDMYTKEPWTYENGIGSLVKEYLRLRHRLVPFLYSAAYRTYLTNYSLIEPLYYYYPEEQNAYVYKNEYFFLNQLLIAPITHKCTYKNKCIQEVYLPEGHWVDIFTNDEYDGNRVVKMVRNLTSIPVLAKSGAIITYSDDQNYNSIENPKNLQIAVYKGNGNFTLYEDDANKNMCQTVIDTSLENDIQKVSILFINEQYMIPNRSIRVVFKNIFKGEVYCNENVKIKHGECLEVFIKNVNYHKVYEIEIAFEKESKLDILKRQAKYNIQRMEGSNQFRSDFYNKLLTSSTIKEFKNIVKEAKLNRYDTLRLLECK